MHHHLYTARTLVAVTWFFTFTLICHLLLPTHLVAICRLLPYVCGSVLVYGFAAFCPPPPACHPRLVQVGCRACCCVAFVTGCFGLVTVAVVHHVAVAIAILRLVGCRLPAAIRSTTTTAVFTVTFCHVGSHSPFVTRTTFVRCPTVTFTFPGYHIRCVFTFTTTAPAFVLRLVAITFDFAGSARVAVCVAAHAARSGFWFCTHGWIALRLPHLQLRLVTRYLRSFTLYVPHLLPFVGYTTLHYGLQLFAPCHLPAAALIPFYTTFTLVGSHRYLRLPLPSHHRCRARSAPPRSHHGSLRYILPVTLRSLHRCVVAGFTRTGYRYLPLIRSFVRYRSLPLILRLVRSGSLLPFVLLGCCVLRCRAVTLHLRGCCLRFCSFVFALRCVLRSFVAFCWFVTPVRYLRYVIIVRLFTHGYGLPFARTRLPVTFAHHYVVLHTLLRLRLRLFATFYTFPLPLRCWLHVALRCVAVTLRSGFYVLRCVGYVTLRCVYGWLRSAFCSGCHRLPVTTLDCLLRVAVAFTRCVYVRCYTHLRLHSRCPYVRSLPLVVRYGCVG